MLPDRRFTTQQKHFWANVRSISQTGGYTDRTTKQIRVFSYDEMTKVMQKLKLKASHIVEDGEPTELGVALHAYFQYRADVLNNFVRLQLMNLEDAQDIYKRLHKKHKPSCPLPMNKQKGKMKQPAYLTCIVNMLIEAHVGKLPVNYDPKALTTVTMNGMPLRTLARQVDGCFPSVVNPIAIWEIKEYYHNKSFGSRVADGVYESLLDGIELEELRKEEGVDIQHLLIVDSLDTWWSMGRSYLCRLIDMLNMGYVDEILFGREVLSRLPEIVGGWRTTYKTQKL